MSIKNKKISFVIYNYPLTVSTMLLNTIVLLSKENSVKIFTNEMITELDISDSVIYNNLVKSEIKESKLIIYLRKFIPNIRFLRQFLYTIVQIFRNMIYSWESKNRNIFIFADNIKDYLYKNKTDIIIAIEVYSLIAACEVTKKLNYDIDLMYFDMELLDWRDSNSMYEDKLELKKRQFNALKSVKHVFITSNKRAEIFSRINRFSLQSISVLPVVPRRREIDSSSNYFRNKFNISNDKLVVIYSGNFMPWAQCFEIIQSMNKWPNNVVLILHTWNKASLKTKYFDMMKEAAKNYEVFFSTEFLPYDKMASALSSADIGLLYYQEIDENFTEICFSSNKMGEYIASGLPIICSPFPSLKSFVDSHEIGKAVHFDDIGNAIKIIMDNLSDYKKNTEKCCNKYFIFDNYFNKAFENIR